MATLCGGPYCVLGVLIGFVMAISGRMMAPKNWGIAFGGECFIVSGIAIVAATLLFDFVPVAVCVSAIIGFGGMLFFLLGIVATLSKRYDRPYESGYHSTDGFNG